MGWRRNATTSSRSKLQAKIFGGTSRAAVYRTDWVVYAKAPFGGAVQVFAYLRTMDERGVNFDTKGGRECTFSGVDFLWRFRDRVFAKSFTRIRHFGLLAPRSHIDD